jgi:hypothetical protein
MNIITMRRSRWATTIITAAGACGMGAAVRADGGGTAVTDTVTTDTHPARLTAPDGRLTIEGDRLTGRIKGGTYAVQIAADRARGQGALGAIDVSVRKLGQGFGIEGVWNGGPISFVVSDTAVRGSADRPQSDEDRSFASCHYDVEKLRGRATYAGREECLGVTNPVRFDLAAQAASGLHDARTAVLLIAYLLAPPTHAAP